MCPECGSHVISDHPRKKFCSDKCQKNFNARKNHKKCREICAVCSKSIENVKSRKRFCSEQCRLKGKNLRREERAYLKKKHLVERLDGKCCSCGYHKSIRALQFHHLDETTKEFTIGENLIYKSLAILEAEADKCILLCANCHFEEHDNWIKYQCDLTLQCTETHNP